MYQTYGALYLTINIALLFIVGLFVNGPYALITTSVSAELGQHKSLEGNAKALATVTAIIDGTGSIGAAVGPLIAGLVQNSGWNNVFYMLIASNIVAMILLTRLVSKECRQYKRRHTRNVRIEWRGFLNRLFKFNRRFFDIRIYWNVFRHLKWIFFLDFSIICTIFISFFYWKYKGSRTFKKSIKLLTIFLKWIIIFLYQLSRCVTKIKNSFGFMRVDQILVAGSLLSPKILI